MSGFTVANFAATSLVQDLATAGTTLYFDDADDVLFPTLSGGNKLALVLSEPTGTNYPEVVYATAIASGVMTIERAREGTSAQDWLVGTQVNHTLTAESIRQLIGLTPKGAYNPATAYVVGDIVTYAGTAYIAVANSTGSTPSSVNTNWQIIFTAESNLLRHGNCKLTLSGANLLLSPHDGTGIMINGVLYAIPSGGVTLGPPATTGVVYNIYAYISSGAVALEYSTTAHAVDAATGVSVKSGDPSRTLVGKARTLSSAWQLVRSYFNRGGHSAQGPVASASTAATSPTDLGGSFLAGFLAWSGEVFNLALSGFGAANVSGQSVYSQIFVDAANVTTASSGHTSTTAGHIGGLGLSIPYVATEGYHTVTPGIQSSTGASTASFTGAVSANLQG